MQSFRIRFTLSERSAINADENSVLLYIDDRGREISLTARTADKAIREEQHLVLKAAGWETETNAGEAGAMYRDALVYALARTRIGGDLGDRAPKGAFTEHGLAMVEERVSRRVLNDEHGLMVFPTDASPLFVSTDMTARVGAPLEKFKGAFMEASQGRLRLTDRGRLSSEFFSASFFTEYADARFLLLFMALEALVEQESRRLEIQRLVDDLERMVEESDVDDQERRSIAGSLRWLRVDSIRQAGRKLVRNRAADEYSGIPAEALFLTAYDTRNILVHGHSPPPTRDEVDQIAARLEVMVSDLICHPSSSQMA